MKKFLSLHFVALMLLVGMHAHAEDAPTVNPQTKNEVSGMQGTPGKVDVFADFLAWYASEEPEALWANVFVDKSDPSSALQENTFAFDWNYGFRVGSGYCFEYDHWDTQLYWTWFRTEAHNSVPVSSKNSIISQFFGGFIDFSTALGAKIHW